MTKYIEDLKTTHVPMESRTCGCVVPESIYCVHTPTPSQIDDVAKAIAAVKGSGWKDYQRQAEAAWDIVLAALGITDDRE